MALGWTAPTSAFGVVVRNAKRSHVTSPSVSFRTLVQPAQMPAKNANGSPSARANHTGMCFPSGVRLGSEKAVSGTMKAVAEHLGNTPTVARTSYVDPRLVDRFMSGEVIPIASYSASEKAVQELLRD